MPRKIVVVDLFSSSDLVLNHIFLFILIIYLLKSSFLSFIFLKRFKIVLLNVVNDNQISAAKSHHKIKNKKEATVYQQFHPSQTLVSFFSNWKSRTSHPNWNPQNHTTNSTWKTTRPLIIKAKRGIKRHIWVDV